MNFRGIAAAASVAVGTVAYVHCATATVYNFDTSTGTLTTSNGTPTGGTWVAGQTPLGEVFSFSGNVSFNLGDVVNVTGVRPLVIQSYNDLTVASGVTINLSASGTYAGPGGGAGGIGGTGGAGGAGGTPPDVGPLAIAGALNGGSGGAGGGSYSSGSNGQPGQSGSGFDGTGGSSGTVGAQGAEGSAAFGVARSTLGGGGGGGGFGQGGLTGVNGQAGQGGVGGGGGTTAYSGSTGGSGGPGANGGNGINGGTGNPGANGFNAASLTLLAGGNGGAGGGGGQGGGGGGTGGVGGGGGGGGGGGAHLVGGGGSGGNGGAGALGGAGGNGGQGGSGGSGGGGGGAIELYAAGRLTVNGYIEAQGAAGKSGFAGASGAYGTLGGTSIAGQPGSPPADASGAEHGGDGGTGGFGGSGGVGGAGGNGGVGGAGAGGTIVLAGSSVNAADGALNTLGGGDASTNGKLFIATNSQISAINHVSGGLPEYSSGPVGQNPFTASTTPNIPDLAGGVAAPYGILANLQANSSVFSGLAANAPTHTLAAVLLGSSGLPGYSDVFPGYQWVFVVNLSGSALNGLKIGLSSNSATFDAALAQQNLSITGSGTTGNIHILTSTGIPLPANDVYAFLAPTSLIDSGTLYATADGALPLTMTSDYGLVTPGFLPVGYLQSASATPEPAAAALTLAALSGLLLLPRGRAGAAPTSGRA